MKERFALLFLLLALPILVSASTFTRPLIIGSHGSDVSALQTTPAAQEQAPEEAPVPTGQRAPTAAAVVVAAAVQLPEQVAQVAQKQNGTPLTVQAVAAAEEAPSTDQGRVQMAERVRSMVQVVAERVPPVAVPLVVVVAAPKASSSSPTHPTTAASSASSAGCVCAAAFAWVARRLRIRVPQDLLRSVAAFAESFSLQPPRPPLPFPQIGIRPTTPSKQSAAARVEVVERRAVAAADTPR
jgi:hypothetical protein